MHAFAIAAFLVTWCLLGIALVRRAERSVDARSPLPTPWREVVIGTLVALVAVTVCDPWQAAIGGAACIALVVAGGADARTGYLFDAITLPAAILVAMLAICADDATTAAWGVVVMVGTFGAIVVCSRGRAMGLGDVKAMYAIGAAFGPFESLVVIFAACLSGIVAAKLRGAFARGAEVRFGPHLAVGSFVGLIAGDPIVHRYMGL